MNILDTKGQAEKFLSEQKSNEGFDYLASIFSQQRALMVKYGLPDRLDINSKEGQQELKYLLFMTCEELMEAANAFKNRRWTKSQTIVDLNHVHEEIADALGFFIQFCITIGLDPESLFKLYAQKRLVNEFRIESNY